MANSGIEFALGRRLVLSLELTGRPAGVNLPTSEATGSSSRVIAFGLDYRLPMEPR